MNGSDNKGIYGFYHPPTYSSDAKESSEVFDKLMKRAKNILEELESLAKCDYLDEEEKASAMDALKKRLQDVYKKISSIGEDNE
jgi:hypothetical protein